MSTPTGIPPAFVAVSVVNDIVGQFTQAYYDLERRTRALERAYLHVRAGDLDQAHRDIAVVEQLFPITGGFELKYRLLRANFSGNSRQQGVQQAAEELILNIRNPPPTDL